MKEADLVDDFGMKFVSAFLESAEEAAARGKTLHPDYLSYLVFIIRNDVVHHHSQVSRRAYQCLVTYLARYPHAVVAPPGADEGRDDGGDDHGGMHPAGDDDQVREEGSGGKGAGGAGGAGIGRYPTVVVCNDTAWLPFFKTRGGFFHKALMSEDMSVAGQEYGREEYGEGRLGVPSRSGRPMLATTETWKYVDEMLLCFTNRALESNLNDWNGDLLLFHYLVRVMRQDLDARMEVIRQIHAMHADARPAGRGVSQKKSADLPVRQMKSLLQNAAMWRMLLEKNFNAKLMKQMVHGLVQLVVDVNGGEEEELPTQEFELELEEEDDSPAGVCALSKAGLASLASAFLTGMLDLFGMMERLGGFHAIGSHRAASANYRMALDEYMVDSFWTEHGFCGDQQDANAFLYSLRPRDALRFVGFAVADKFTKTYDEAYVKTHYPESVEAVQELFSAMHTLTVASRDASTFFEIGVDSVLAALVMDINRTVRMFKSADHVCLLVGAVASSLDKLLLEGEEVPTGKTDVAGIKTALRKVVDSLYENEASTNTASRISSFGSVNLSLAALFFGQS